MIAAVLLRSGMMGNYHVPFCRAVEGATPSLTLIITQADTAQFITRAEQFLEFAQQQIDSLPPP